VPKYYVESGRVRGIAAADTAEQAAAKIVLKAEPEMLSLVTVITESGFEYTEQSIIMLTRHCLETPRSIHPD
jgi:hypothetical protein